MINMPAASIVTAHHHADNSRSIRCDSAQPRIPDDKLSNAFFVVAFGNLQAFDSLPELKRCIVIFDRKFPSHDVTTHIDSSCRAKSRHPAKSPKVAPRDSSTALGMTFMDG